MGKGITRTYCHNADMCEVCERRDFPKGARKRMKKKEERAWRVGRFQITLRDAKKEYFEFGMVTRN